jgi:hypothetical protein
MSDPNCLDLETFDTVQEIFPASGVLWRHDCSKTLKEFLTLQKSPLELLEQSLSMKIDQLLDKQQATAPLQQR